MPDFFLSSFPTIPDRTFLLWKDTRVVPVADNRETVLPGAAVALIGFLALRQQK